MPQDTPATPPVVPPKPPNGDVPAQPSGEWAERWAKIWAHLQTARFWLIFLIAISAAYMLLVARPFDTAPPQLSEEDVSTQWNASIARLGIKAVYPPQEDFRVGDVWAIVADAPAGKPVLGKSVRIAQIALDDYILGNDDGRPVFAETTPPEANKPAVYPSRFSSAVSSEERKKITTSIAAFPAITINHTASSSSGSSLAWLGLNSSRAGQQYEQVHIKMIETYGAQPLEAYAVFKAWCADKDTKTYCKDDSLARELLAAAVSPDVLELDKEGRYTTQIELRLVTRVFMSREITTRRWVVDSSGAAVEINNDAKGASLPQVLAQAPPPPPAAGGAVGPATPPTPLPGAGSAPPATAARVASQWSNAAEIGLNSTFQRPVVFGFRSIRHKLPMSQPPKPNPAPESPAASDATKKTEK